MPKVLVIDDAREMRALMKVFLQKQGYSVVTADSARTGLTELLADRFDLVLLDLEMPGEDGAACLAAIRRNKPTASIRVVMVTATPIREVLLRVVKLGVQGVVIKSGNWLPILLQQITKTLGGPLHTMEQHAGPPAGNRGAAAPGMRRDSTGRAAGSCVTAGGPTPSWATRPVARS